MPATFIQISFDEIDCLLEDPKLSGNVFRVWLYLSKLDPFGDRGRRLPTYEQIAYHLKISVDTVRRSLNKLEELGFVVIDHLKTKTFSNPWKNIKSGLSKVRSKFFSPQHKCDKNSIDANLEAAMQDKKHLCNFQQLELLPDKKCALPQTIQKDQTPQTAEEANKNTKEDRQQNTAASGGNKPTNYTVLPKHKPKKQIPPSVAQKKHKIPEDLMKRLEMSDIPVSEQVLVKISQHHISQAYGAVTYVENSRASIRDPKAIFLLQLPKQPVEKLGQRHSDELLNHQIRELQKIEQEQEDPNYFGNLRSTLDRIKQNLSKKIDPFGID